MTCPLELARPVSYLLVTAGCLVATVFALEPELTGAYHLAAGYLVCGLIPYVVYGSCTEILDACTLPLAGTTLLAADLVARLAWDIHAAGQVSMQPAIWLCMLLVLIVFPAGILLGKLAGRLLA